MLRVYRSHLAALEYADTDELTGLANRRTFDDQFSRIVLAETRRKDGRRESTTVAARARISRSPTSTFSSRVNDRFGHPYGDEVLVLFAGLMRDTFREGDKLFRFGGEEFVVLISNCGVDDALIAFERFRAAVEAFQFPQVGRVTVSIGVTSLHPRRYRIGRVRTRGSGALRRQAPRPQSRAAVRGLARVAGAGGDAQGFAGGRVVLTSVIAGRDRRASRRSAKCPRRPRSPRPRPEIPSPRRRPASRSVPMPSGGGIFATKAPNAAASSDQISVFDRRARRRRRRAAGRALAGPFRAARKAGSRAWSRRCAHEAGAELGELAIERQAASDARRRRRVRSRPGAGGSAGAGRRHEPGRAHRRARTRLDRAASAGQRCRPCAARRDQRHARRQAVAAHSRGDGDGGEIEQIDEVRVGPEPRVEPHRIGQHLRDRVEARHRRHEHHVEAAPRRRRRPLQRGELIEGFEGARSRRICARLR